MGNQKRPLVLTILDGWGYRAETANNAIALARKPTYDKLLQRVSQHADPGLGALCGPARRADGQQRSGPPEHRRGAHCADGHHAHRRADRVGRVLKRIRTIVQAMKQAREGGRQLHLFGLVSDGGVHSHQEHLYALLRIAREYGLKRVFVHAFMDGRDTPPTSGAGYIAQLEQKMREYGVGKVATVNGRYYAMDRDKRWERERKAFDAMVNGKAEGGAYPDAVDAHQGVLQRRDDRRVPGAVRGDRRGGQAGGPDPRRRCVHQLQLPRRPRAADHARAGARERIEQAGRPRPGQAGRRSTRRFPAARFRKTCTTSA